MSWVVKITWKGGSTHYEPVQQWKWAADLRASRMRRLHLDATVTVISRERAMAEKWPNGIPR